MKLFLSADKVNLPIIRISNPILTLNAIYIKTFTRHLFCINPALTMVLSYQMVIQK